MIRLQGQRGLFFLYLKTVHSKDDTIFGFDPDRELALVDGVQRVFNL